MTFDILDIKKRFTEVRVALNMSQIELANAIGKDKTAISKIESEKETNRRPSLSILLAMQEKLGVNRAYIESGVGAMFRTQLDSLEPKDENKWFPHSQHTPRIEASPISLHPHKEDDPTGVAKYVYAADGTAAMRVKIVPIKAQAGYLLGYGDPEYYEDFDTELILVDKEHAGTYLGFEVKGDSMITTDPEKMRYNIYPGWIAIGRDLPRQKWAYKLHTHSYDYWIIVHKTEGILIKEISYHDVTGGKITIHSLNPEYEDKEINLADVEQIFSVVQMITKTKR